MNAETILNAFDKVTTPAFGISKYDERLTPIGYHEADANTFHPSLANKTTVVYSTDPLPVPCSHNLPITFFGIVDCCVVSPADYFVSTNNITIKIPPVNDGFIWDAYFKQVRFLEDIKKKDGNTFEELNPWPVTKAVTGTAYESSNQGITFTSLTPYSIPEGTFVVVCATLFQRLDYTNGDRRYMLDTKFVRCYDTLNAANNAPLFLANFL